MPPKIVVVEAAAERVHWGSPLAVNQGRGIASTRYSNRSAYCAVVIELSVNRENGEIKLEHAFIVGDSGQVVNPDDLSNQLEGGFMQSTSMTLKE
jgi:CO/xanthine dehydrogenase Mo-binding subunit